MWIQYSLYLQNIYKIHLNVTILSRPTPTSTKQQFIMRFWNLNSVQYKLFASFPFIIHLAHLTNQPNNFVEHSPWDVRSASQEIPRLLRNPKVHYRVHKRPPLAFITARWIQFTPSLPFSLSYMLILSSHLRLGLQGDLFPSGFTTKFVCISQLSHSFNMPHPSHPPWFVDSNNIWWRVQIMKLLSM
jgi:hypothetical protein